MGNVNLVDAIGRPIPEKPEEVAPGTTRLDLSGADAKVIKAEIEGIERDLIAKIWVTKSNMNREFYLEAVDDLDDLRIMVRAKFGQLLGRQASFQNNKT
jgi:hypothetical protein